ncbi:YjeO family protein [Xenorhabdus khoisanae]|uniref:YjeO family protein n=1 Tax=Xenorhabdus khoisanae TaxID=880157 RepID=UPI0023583BE1|nr:YjeO family protein [Xenorhabdus khoisanae]MDC9613948.1 YjeO family protein [Xenorhabdus khoisanae]
MVSSKILCIIYYVFCLLIIYSFSFFEEEIYIDGAEIKNACVAHRTFVADDTRDVSAPVAALFILPLLFKIIKIKFKSLKVNIMLISLIMYWVWRFFIRIILC